MSKKIIDCGGDAFPGSENMSTGMTLRDYFAAKAMNAEISLYPIGTNLRTFEIESISEAAYKMADAMIKERKK